MNTYGAIETARFFQRMGLQQAALLNSMAAVASAGSPLLRGAFEANAATAELWAHEGEESDFNITHTEHKGITHFVEEEHVKISGHTTLLRFNAPTIKEEQPKVLVIAPLSGHDETLLKPTVQELIPDHHVSIVKWHNPKHVSLEEHGSFDLNTYIHDLQKCLEEMGPNTHVVAVCQPGVPLVALLSAMEEQGHPCLPISATFKGSPIDTSVSPTKVNEGPQKLKQIWGGSQGAIDNHYAHMLSEVTSPHRGQGQVVHHGLTQLGGFYGLDPQSHAKAHIENWFNIAFSQNSKDVERHDTFYKGYNHVMDLPGEYLMQTLDVAFLNQRIKDGTFRYTNPETRHVHQVDPANIQNTALFAVEGAGDTITGLGQTVALLDMATNLDPSMKRYRRSPKGHYGLFAGGDFRDETAPEVRGFIREIEAHHSVGNDHETHKDVRKPNAFTIDNHPELQRH